MIVTYGSTKLFPIGFVFLDRRIFHQINIILATSKFKLKPKVTLTGKPMKQAYLFDQCMLCDIVKCFRAFRLYPGKTVNCAGLIDSFSKTIFFKQSFQIS